MHFSNITMEKMNEKIVYENDFLKNVNGKIQNNYFLYSMI